MKEVEHWNSFDKQYLDQIVEILSQALGDRKCSIYLFGSRAAGKHAHSSDFDVAVLAAEAVDRELSLAREMLEFSNIPFTVDVVDLRSASEHFLRAVQEQGILLWSN